MTAPGLRTPPPPKSRGRAPHTFLLSHGVSFEASLAQASFDPSGRRSVEQIAAAVSTGRKPSCGSMPQFILDGLPPDVHLDVALSIRHPVCAAPSCTVAVKYVAKHTIDSTACMVERRARVCSAIDDLAKALDDEHNVILDRCDSHVTTVICFFRARAHRIHE